MEMYNYSQPVKLYDVTFKNRLLNSAGCWCTTEKELMDLVNSDCGGIVSKSCLLNPYDGNPKPRYYGNPNLSINSTGLANLGHRFYNSIGKTIREKKPYIISVGVKNIENTLTILKNIQEDQNCDFIELNVSCPNILNSPILGYNPTYFDTFLKMVFNPELGIKDPNKTKIGLKMPPYLDVILLKQIASIIEKYPVKYIATINGMPNGLVLDNNYIKTIEPNNGIGGVGGPCVKPFGLSNVKMFHELLPNIPIIGCGGISSAKDIKDYLSVGATLVQIGSRVVLETPSCFTRLLAVNE